MHTQFDAQLLDAGAPAAPSIGRNHGRQVVALPDGTTLTALAFGGERPRVRLWQNRQLMADHPLEIEPAAPVLTAQGDLASAGDSPGSLVDAAATTAGEQACLLQDGARLMLVSATRAVTLDAEAGRASLDIDEAGTAHVVYEKRQGLEYATLRLGDLAIGHRERVAEAYGSHPVVLAIRGRVIIAFLGESCRLPSYQRWGDAWERLGHGGYIGALVREADAWRRFRLADSRQIVKPLRPIDTAYGGGPEVGLRVRIEEYSPPALTLGPDGVPQVLWANVERRWIYAARFLGEEFSPAIEVRGPFEQLTGPVLAPKRMPATRPGIPLAIMTKTRVYLDELVLPPRTVSDGRQIDFVQFDELGESRGLEPVLNTLERFDGNPVIPVGPPGSRDDGAVLADVTRAGERWEANLSYQRALARDPHRKAETWHWDGRAVSEDGFHWRKLDPVPVAEATVVGEDAHTYNIRYVADPAEPNPQHRYKGMWRAPTGGPWAWRAVTSPDARTWTKVDSPTVLNADDDLRVWIDPADVPERRFKANAISRSFCGRVAAQWSSADGMHWHDERDTLDFRDPFGAKPDRGTTGRILLDSWAGPDDEDELHGGFVFRDGDRWLLHYMKWTADGHVYCALASSRDGINFSRVAGGAPTLSLGAAGAWDAGRVAIREAPFRVGDTWRQYYAGCGWKHGLAGIGAKTSHWASAHSPLQMGIAEIPVGHWRHLQVRRDTDVGVFWTVPLQLAAPLSLWLDVAGLNRPGSAVRCAVRDTAGFGFAECDPVRSAGPRQPVSWRGRSLADLQGRCVQLGVELAGHGLQLFGLHIEQVTA